MLKKSQQSLKDWSKQDWGTKSGKKSSETGERYLPKKAREALSDSEYAATTAAKRKDKAAGKQHSKQPKKIAEKTARYRKNKGGLIGEGGLLFDPRNPLDYLMFVPGIGALGIGAKALTSVNKINKARKLPKTQYHGGYSSVEKGQANITGIYSTPDVKYANVFSDPKFRTIKDRGSPELYKLDLSKAKNIELTDKPSKKLLKSIDNTLEKIYKKNSSSLSPYEKELETSLSVIFKTNPKSGVRGAAGMLNKPSVIDFLKKEGVEILTDSKTLTKGAKGTGTNAEYYLVKDFPKIKLTKKNKEELVRLGKMYKLFNTGGSVTESSLNNFISLALDIDNQIAENKFLFKKGGKADGRLKRAGVSGYNKPKRTPNHPTKSHIVVAKSGSTIKTIRFGQQGAKTAGKPKAGESRKTKMKRKSFKARHAKNIAKGVLSAAYWANRVKW